MMTDNQANTWGVVAERFRNAMAPLERALLDAMRADSITETRTYATQLRAVAADALRHLAPLPVPDAELADAFTEALRGYLRGCDGLLRHLETATIGKAGDPVLGHDELLAAREANMRWQARLKELAQT